MYRIVIFYGERTTLILTRPTISDLLTWDELIDTLEMYCLPGEGHYNCTADEFVIRKCTDY